MKPGLSLRVSQHLALTPQLQQSIRLLQLSTLELGQEVEQMLDENPFLERASDEAPREEFGLEHANAPAQADEHSADDAIYSGASGVATPRPAPATTPKAMRPTRPNWRVRRSPSLPSCTARPWRCACPKWTALLCAS